MFRLYSRIKNCIGRMQNGFGHEDLWDFSDYLCGIIAPGLRRLKDGSGCPDNFFDFNAKEDQCHKWKEALEEMAIAFDLVGASKRSFNGLQWTKEGGMFKKTLTKDQQKQITEKIEKGLKLFADNFMNLWD